MSVGNWKETELGVSFFPVFPREENDLQTKGANQ